MIHDLRTLIDLVTQANAGIRSDHLDEAVRTTSRLEADRILRAAGYRRLGKGAFAAVYQKAGKPYVLKLFTAADQPYLAFIALARANASNPHFPRFFRKIVRVTPDLYGIRMEPLTPYRYDETLITRYLKLRDYVSPYENSHVAMEREDAFEFMEEYPELRKACDLVIDHLLTRYQIDMKQSNLMMRGRTIVITDPVYDPSQIPDTKEKWSVAEPDPEPEPQPRRDGGKLDKIMYDNDELLRQLLGSG